LERLPFGPITATVLVEALSGSAFFSFLSSADDCTGPSLARLTA